MGKRKVERAPQSSTAESPSVRRSGYALAVAIVTFAVFIPSIAHPFVVWDDGANFVENPHYRGLGLEQLKWMFTTFHLGPYQPLSWVTLGLDWKLWGLDATGYHLTSVLIHAVAAALVCLLSTRLFEAWTRVGSRSGCLFGVAVALIWALHPLRVEAVSWVTERREVLSGAFVFATLLVALRGGRWWSVALLALCAMLAKGTAVVLAPLLILVDVFASREVDARAIFNVTLRSARHHALVVVLAGVFSVVALMGQRSAEALISAEALGVAERLRIFANGIGFYVTKTIWPFGIAPMYDPPVDRSTLNVPALLSILGLVAFIAITWRARAKIGHVWTLGPAYVVSLLPVGGIVQVGSQLAADRYAYQPGMLITLALIGCIGLWLARSWSTALRLCVLALVCGGLMWRTLHMQAIWSSSKALWLHELSEYPDSPIAHLHLGLLQAEGNDPEATPADAERHFRAAIARSPNYADAWCALGDLQRRQGRVDEALAAYETALRAEPHHRAACEARANTLWRLQRHDEALAGFRRLCELAPNDFQSHLLLARTLSAAGDSPNAITEYERSLALASDALRPAVWFAWFLATHPDSSVRNGPRALEIVRAAAAKFGAQDPLWVQAHTAALAEVGRFDEAIAILTEVRRSLPAGAAQEIDTWIEQFQAHEPLRVAPSYP